MTRRSSPTEIDRAEAELRATLSAADLGFDPECLPDDGSNNRSNRPASKYNLRSDRQQLADYVLDDAVPPVAPCIADDEALRRGYLPFWRVEDRDVAVMMKPTWPWEAAIAYIAHQDIQQAAQEVAAYRVWDGRILRNPKQPGQRMSLLQADEALRNALLDGTIRAEGVSGTRRHVIKKGDWKDLDWPRTASGECLKFETLRSFGEDRFTTVIFKATEVQARWRDPTTATPPSQQHGTLGRPLGSGREEADKELMPELHQLILTGIDRGKAYLKVAGKAQGHGGLDSKAKRLARRFKEWEKKGE